MISKPKLGVFVQVNKTGYAVAPFRVARYFLVQHTKTVKIYHNDHKINQNGHKIYEMAVK
jgi:hypothetical protein